jgi:hypothetical protein
MWIEAKPSVAILVSHIVDCPEAMRSKLVPSSYKDSEVLDV